MRDPQNIRAVKSLGIDMLGLIFWPKSPRFVRGLVIRAGIVPDAANKGVTTCQTKDCKTVGVFVNEMPQTLITHAYNYHLDYIQLHGDESPTYIDNLKRTLIPDILPDVKVIKALSIREADDVKRWRRYEGHADLLLFDTKCTCVGGSGEQFDWDVLRKYDGNIPFLLSGGIGPDNAERLKDNWTWLEEKGCIGIDLNSRFEDAPAMKNVEKLSAFINNIR